MFDSTTRNRLAAFVSDARRLLCGEYNKPGGEITSLLQTYGIQPDGTVADLDTLPGLDQRGYELASTLRDVLAHKRANVVGLKAWGRYDPHVYDLIQEQAFTVLNRLCALRMAEERGILPNPVISKGLGSDGFELYEMVADKKHLKRDERYETFLFSVFDELSLDLGVLFDRHSPHGMLFPRSDALGELLEELNHPDLALLWAADETIGWIYQYWNSKEERKAMRDASAAPRNSRELAVRNQFFTPRYVVEFLTDNTLGRIWYEMTKGETRLAEQCRYLVRRPCEFFLGGPETLFWHNAAGTEEFHEFNRTGAPQHLPENPALGVVLGWAASLRRESIEITLSRAGFDRDTAMETVVSPLQAGRASEDLSAINPTLLIQALWCFHDQYERSEGPIHLKEPVVKDAAVYPIWRALREQLQSPPNGRSQEELLRRPVFIPHRPLKDPLEIRLLDPACGSMHFGLYAFDLFETIYEEAWARRLVPETDFGGDTPPFDHASVQKKEGITRVKENYSSELIEVATARVVILESPDSGDGLFHEGPYVREPGGNFRPAIVREMPLAEFDYVKALATGWITEEQGERLVRETDAFECSRFDPLPEEEVQARFFRDIPRLIIEHNIHGVDIDPRAVQIAGLSLWLRAQKTWRDTPTSQRPRVRRSNIVCAEPMPGSDAMLEDFVQTLDPPLLGELVQTVFDKMQLAGEAGTLLKIEEEIRTAIDDAKAKWKNSGNELPGLEAEPRTSDLRFLTSDFWNSAEERIYAALRDYAESAEAGDYQRRLFAEDAAHGFAFIDLCRKRYDAVVMNPPFGVFSTRWKNDSRIAYPNSYNDILAAFVDSFVERLLPRGFLGAITSRSSLFLLSYQNWRNHVLLERTNPLLLADLGQGVMDAAMVESAAYVLEKTAATIPLYCSRLLAENDKPARLAQAVDAAITGNLPRNCFVAAPVEFLSVPGSPFCYWVGSHIRELFQSLNPFDSGGRDAKQGLATGEDFRFVRAWWEVPPELVVSILRGSSQESYSAATNGRAAWVPFAKGGAFSPFYQDLNLVVRWSDDGREIRNFANPKTGYIYSRYRGADRYFTPGFTYADRAATRFAPRILPEGAIISVKGSGIYCGVEDNAWAALSVLNSTVFSQLMDLLLGRVDLAKSYQVNTVGRVPWPAFSKQAIDELSSYAKDGWTQSFEGDRSEPTSHAFVAPEIQQSSGDTIKLRHSDWKQRIAKLEKRLSEIQGAVDSTALRSYGLSARDSKVIEEASTSPIQGDEDLVDQDRIHPQGLPIGEFEYSLGSILGRWDIRYATGERQPPELPDPFDPLPVCPPGMLQNADGLPAAPADVPDDYPLRITWPGILVSDPGHPEDIVARVRDALAVIWGDRSAAIEQEACEILSVRTLRDYFAEKKSGGKFFKDHLKRYSKSRRQAPIYWPLSTESGTYTLWIYYHRLTEDTLYACITNFVAPKQEQSEKTLARLAAKGDARTATEDKEYEQTEALIGELATFRAELERLAKIWKPNLNDGVQITAAPLWNLFRLKPWQTKLKSTWNSLEKGDYDWAHLAHTLWPDRVIPKCGTDRSLAIAHGYEEDLWEEVENEKGKLVWLAKSNAEELARGLIAQK